MKTRGGMLSVISLNTIAVLVGLSGMAAGIPGGTQIIVTDMAPACAICHAVAKADYAPELSPERSAADLPVNKHYKVIESADRGYKVLPEDKRKALLEQVKWVDENSSISLNAPTSAKPSQPIEVTVETKGGIGPNVGIMLVDKQLRYQSRPIAADGWYVVGKPTVIGPDAKEQSWWLDKRPDEKKNLSFVLVQAKADPEKKTLPTAKVTWTLRTPIDPGTYTITAAFLYGTEEPDEYKTGKLEPPPAGSGTSAASGRIQFSAPVTVTVK
jgi:hypothetical protein